MSNQSPDEQSKIIAQLTTQLQAMREAVEQCEQDRLNAQLSGLETGWEHPGTQTMFKRCVFLARSTTPTTEQVKKEKE